VLVARFRATVGITEFGIAIFRKIIFSRRRNKDAEQKRATAALLRRSSQASTGPLLPLRRPTSTSSFLLLGTIFFLYLQHHPRLSKAKQSNDIAEPVVACSRQQ